MMEIELDTKKAGNFMLLPPAKDVCQECAVRHKPEEPHDVQSLYYQYKFNATHGRWPNWSDAIVHCPKEIKELWMAELKACGAWKD